MDFTKSELKLIYYAVNQYKTTCESKLYLKCEDILNKIDLDVKPPLEPAYDLNFYE